VLLLPKKDREKRPDELLDVWSIVAALRSGVVGLRAQGFRCAIAGSRVARNAAVRCAVLWDARSSAVRPLH
jgi:hypothetical protein